MGIAKTHDGVAIAGYINGKAVDSEGAEVKGAPKRAPNTDPSLQPGAIGGPSAEERIGAAIANALIQGQAAAAGTIESSAAPMKPVVAAKAEDGAEGSEGSDGNADDASDGAVGDEGEGGDTKPAPKSTAKKRAPSTKK